MTWAMEEAPEAISENPKIAAIIAMMKKIAAHFNIRSIFRVNYKGSVKPGHRISLA